jgi:ADP-ribose diphosphatase
MNFKLKQSRILYKGKVFDLKVDDIEYNSGNKSIREVAVHPGGVVIIPVTAENKLVMVSQFRYPLQKSLLEFPAGKLEKDEDPPDCAVRELKEETGYTPGNISKLGEIYTAPGYCTELLHIYVAKDLKKGNHNREEGETGMLIYQLTMDEIEEKIKFGEITDAKTICSIHFLKTKVTL